MNKEQLLNAREEWNNGYVKRAEENAEKIIKKWQKDFIEKGYTCIDVTSLCSIEFDIIKNKLKKKGFEFDIDATRGWEYYSCHIVITNL